MNRTIYAVGAGLIELVRKAFVRVQPTGAEQSGVAGHGMRFVIRIDPRDRGPRIDRQRRKTEILYQALGLLRRPGARRKPPSGESRS